MTNLTPASFTTWIVPELKKLPCGSQIIEAYLTGSRSPRSPKPPRSDSDWDVLLILKNEPPILETGPLIHYRLTAPDGNTVEILRCDTASWENPNPHHLFVVTCKASGFRLM